jgi:hypothetical protein
MEFPDLLERYLSYESPSALRHSTISCRVAQGRKASRSNEWLYMQGSCIPDSGFHRSDGLVGDNNYE